MSLATAADRAAVIAVFEGALGTSGIVVDLVRSKATVRFQFPGDIDPVMRELHRRGFTHSATLAIAVRVTRDPGGSDSLLALIDRLEALPTVSNAAFDGNVLSATIAAQSAAMRSLYDEIVSAGLVPVDVPALTRTGVFP